MMMMHLLVIWHFFRFVVTEIRGRGIWPSTFLTTSTTPVGRGWRHWVHLDLLFWASIGTAEVTAGNGPVGRNGFDNFLVLQR